MISGDEKAANSFDDFFDDYYSRIYFTYRTHMTPFEGTEVGHFSLFPKTTIYSISDNIGLWLGLYDSDSSNDDCSGHCSQSTWKG